MGRCHAKGFVDFTTKVKTLSLLLKINFLLKKGSDGDLYLDHKHSYYYQVQTQLFIGYTHSNRVYAVSFAWTARCLDLFVWIYPQLHHL